MKGWLAILALALSIFAFASASLADPVITTKTSVNWSFIDHILITFENHIKAGSILLGFFALFLLLIQGGRAAREWAKHRRNGTTKNGSQFVTHDEFNAFKEQNEREHEQMHKALNRIDDNLKHIRENLIHLTKKVDKCFSEIHTIKKERK